MPQKKIRVVWIPKDEVAIEPINLKSDRFAELSKIVKVI